MKQVLALASITALGAACGGSSTPAEPDASTVGEDVTVTAFSGEHVSFAGEDDRRAVDAEVSFPSPGQSYERVTLRLGLRCPTPAAPSAPAASTTAARTPNRVTSSPRCWSCYGSGPWMP